MTDDRSAAPSVDRPGRIVALAGPDPRAVLARAFAIRDAGGVPLIGDDRWDSHFWARVRDTVESADPVPGAAWATFSSGSSGRPRVILRSETSWSASFPAITRLLDLTSADAVYLPSPLASSIALFSAAHARAVGATLVFPSAHAVTGADFEDATVMHATPTATRTVLDLIEQGAPHRLRVALVGGAHLEDGLRERAAAAGIRVVSYYGAAELSFVAVDTDGQGLRALDGVELQRRDGQLWVRSALFADGYLGDARGSFRVDAEGWGTVGDLADLSESGILTLRGRADGAILSAAATVVPEDVEAALLSIPGIEAAVVFGVPNAGAGSLVAAALQTSDGVRPSAPRLRELRDEARTRLAPSHLPRRWFWAERLPRTATGKPARAQIRDDALAGRSVRLE